MTLDTEQVFAGDASMKVVVSTESSFAEIVETFDPIDSGTLANGASTCTSTGTESVSNRKITCSLRDNGSASRAVTPSQTLPALPSSWLDDSLALSTSVSQEAIINGGISEFRAGIGWIGTGQTFSTVPFDNILVATSPVECAD